MFKDAITAWRNASLVSARLSIEQEIGSRETFLIGGLWSGIKLVGNDFIVKPASALTAMVTPWETKAKEPAAMPEIPKEFTGTLLAENLEKAYKQKCESVMAGAKSAQAIANLDVNGYQRQSAIAAHQAALNNVALPENVRGGGADIGIGATLGALIPDDVKKGVAEGIFKKATNLLS